MSWIELLDLAQDRDAVRVRQAIVEQDQIDALLELLERGAAGVGFEHVVAVRLEALGQRPADQGFIVNDENRGFRHKATGAQR